MQNYENEEENLDNFMVKAASILSEENNPQKRSIIESLKQYLSSIFQIQNEMVNLFRTLNGVIFSSKSSGQLPQKIDNKQPFILYPIIFSFNPKTTSYFLDYYLNCLQRCICEENKNEFTFISEVFADSILALFSDEKSNTNLIKKNYLLEENKKKNIYEKILNYCNKNIRTNKRLEQSFGCLLLTEFIEKCPMVKDDINLDNLFKIISDYLDDRWFECKVDLLNCTISLTFSVKKKFKPYANSCLFRIIDFLTDSDWMKRKLAINIVYTLLFYCRDEIMVVKDNIYEILNVLKEDPVEEVRKICKHILKLMGGEEGNDNIDDDNDGGENEKTPTIRSSKINKAQKNKNNINTINENKNKNQDKKSNYNNNNSINDNNKSKSNISNLPPKSKQNLNEVNPLENKDLESINSTLNSILGKIKKIQVSQLEFKEMLENLKQAEGNNYMNLNERLKALEEYFSNYNRKEGYGQSNNKNEKYNYPKTKRF